MIRNYVAASMLLCSIGSAGAATDQKENIPSSQLAAFQPQADHLAGTLVGVIHSAEASAKTLPSIAREAAIQSAVQDAIMASGNDPRVVLAALQAFSLCPTTPGRYSVTRIPVTCQDLRQPLSAEAREALASLEKVIVGLVDRDESPSALGFSGAAPFVTQQDSDRRGGGRVANSGTAHDPAGDGTPSNTSTIETEPGPGGGGSSGYNTN
jgi:hypothetical protein